MADKKILIVDDEEDFVRTTALRLSFEGYEVFEATDGEKALQMVNDKKPSLILLDIMMPGISGVEVSEKLAGDPETAKIPIIFLTVWERLLPSTAIRDMDNVRHLIKPFDFQKLIAAIEELLGK